MASVAQRSSVDFVQGHCSGSGIYQCQHELSATYVSTVSDELRRPVGSRHWSQTTNLCCCASSTSLDVGMVGWTRLTCALSTVADRYFPVTSARPWSSLPSPVTAAPSLYTFRSTLSSKIPSFLFFWLFSFSLVHCSLPAQWLVILDTRPNRYNRP